MNKNIEILRNGIIELAENNRVFALNDLKLAKAKLDSAIKYAVYCGIPEDEINDILKGIDSAIKISVTRV